MARLVAVELTVAAAALELRGPLQLGAGTAALLAWVRARGDLRAGPGSAGAGLEAMAQAIARRRARARVTARPVVAWRHHGDRHAELPRLAPGGGAADAPQQPASRRGRDGPADLVVYGGIGKAARNWSELPHDRARAAPAGRPRDPAGAVGKAGGGVRDAPRRSAGADRQLQPRAPVGQLGDLPRAGRRRADDVRPDDRRVLDLHRQPGHPAGHLRDVRRRRAQALRRHAGRPAGGHRRPGRDGRRAAAGHHHARRRGAVHRG